MNRFGKPLSLNYYARLEMWPDFLRAVFGSFPSSLAVWVSERDRKMSISLKTDIKAPQWAPPAFSSTGFHVEIAALHRTSLIYITHSRDDSSSWTNSTTIEVKSRLTIKHTNELVFQVWWIRGWPSSIHERCALRRQSVRWCAAARRNKRRYGSVLQFSMDFVSSECCKLSYTRWL